MQKEIQLTDKTLLVVGLEPNCTKVRHFETINELEIVYGDIIFGKEYKYIKLVGNYELLGIYPELTEEQVETLGLDLESFQSLMEREKCYTVNPYNKAMKNNMVDSIEEAEYIQDMFNEAEQRTFSKYAILIKSK